jgi:hypothetical protein
VGFSFLLLLFGLVISAATSDTSGMIGSSSTVSSPGSLLTESSTLPILKLNPLSKGDFALHLFASVIFPSNFAGH